MKRIIISVLLIMALLMFQGVEASAKTDPCLNFKTISIKKGQTVSLKVQNNKKKVKWISENKKVATLKKGKVTGKKAGTTTIKAKIGKKTYSCRVVVSDGKKKSLVVYFSHSGTTKKVAKILANEAGADIIELCEKKAYTQNYNKLLKVAEKEQKLDARPEIVTQIKNINQYDTIYIGYPIWWGKEPMVIRTFLQKYNWKGKKLIPFCTSGGSGIEGSIPGIKKYAKKATVLTGKDLSDMSRTEISNWVKSILKNNIDVTTEAKQENEDKKKGEGQ
ncbi:Flavodoxin [Lachnospiraceae bacterium]|nr:Flavodoxin [Lachnospiraceae bacterium]